MTRQPAPRAIDSMQRIGTSAGAVLADSRVQRLLAVTLFVAALLYLLRSHEPVRVPEAPSRAADLQTLTVPWSGSWNVMQAFEAGDLRAGLSDLDAGGGRDVRQPQPLPDLAHPHLAQPELDSESTPAPDATSDPPGFLEVWVEDGDSLWRLARRHLGQGHLWPRIAAANPQIDPDHLRVGMRLLVPVSTPPGHGSRGTARPSRCVVGNGLPPYTGARAESTARLSPGKMSIGTMPIATMPIATMLIVAVHWGKGSK